MSLAISLLLAACSDDSPAQTTPTASPATPVLSTRQSPKPTSLRTRLPDVLKETGVTQLTQGAPIDPWPSYAFIVETGCWGCEGPTTGFVRVYGRGDGTIVTDELFNSKRSGYSGTYTLNGETTETDPQITGFAFEPDASDMWISLCLRIPCGDSLTTPRPDAETVILRSRDGGVTWSEAGRLQTGAFVVSLGTPGQVIVGTWDAGGQGASLAYFPGLEPITPPGEHYWPVGYLKGGPLWRTASASGLEYGGRTIVELGDKAVITSVFVEPLPEPHGDMLVVWRWPRYESEPALFISMVTVEGQIQKTYEYPHYMSLGVDIGKGLLAGNADVDPSLLPSPLPPDRPVYLPVLFFLDGGDSDNGTHLVGRPMVNPFATADFPNGRNRMVAVQHGDFARVVNAGTCLNVRAEPSESAAVLECVHNNVLLLDIEHASRLISYTPVPGWVEVQTPSGNHGWAAAQYLER